VICVVPSSVAEVDAADERDVLGRILVVAQDDHLLVVAAHPADPLVEDHLAAAVLDLAVQ
jgi:hypothetical protein